MTVQNTNSSILCAATTSPKELEQLLEDNKESMTVVISLGAKHVEEKLPPLLKIVQNSKLTQVTYDPIIGNATDPTPDGIFSDALYELRQFMRIAGAHRLGVQMDLHENKDDQLKPSDALLLRNAHDFYTNAYAAHHILA